MSNDKWRFKHSEVVRTVKAVRSMGLNVHNVEITGDGTIRVNVGGPERAELDDIKTNPWDEVLNNAADQKRPA